MKEADRIGMVERLATAGCLAALFVAGYASAQHFFASHAQPAPVTALDRAIPFGAEWAWAYLWALPAAATPAFVVQSRALFRAAGRGYVLVIAVSLALFAALPETVAGIRPEAAALDPRSASEWLVAFIDGVDPPGAVFPSLHVSLTALSAAVILRADRCLGALALVGVAAVAAAACAIRQHVVLDVAGGLALAALADRLAIGRLTAPAPPGPTRGAVLFLLFAAAFYAAVWAAFRLGLQPP